MSKRKTRLQLVATWALVVVGFLHPSVQDAIIGSAMFLGLLKIAEDL